jgi:2-hydroxy-6-oxonona-2,4-dienedioate hydrolase
MDHLGFDRFHVVGSSLGGLIAASLALRDPQRVISLTVLGSGSVFNDPVGQPDVLQQVYANGSRAYLDPSFDRCRERMSNTCHRLPDASDILLTQMTAYAWPGALESYRAIIEGLAASITDPGASVHRHLEHVRAPTLVVVGANDPRTSIDAHRTGVDRMPDARLVVYPDCGHLPFLEHPDRFNRDLAEFASAPVSATGSVR